MDRKGSSEKTLGRPFFQTDRRSGAALPHRRLQTHRPFQTEQSTANMATTSKPCPYEVLAVARDATPETISTAYKKLARRHHPDRTLTKSEDEKRASETIFKAASDAYEVLTDPAKRRLYDLYGHAGVDSGAAPAADDTTAQQLFEDMFVQKDAKRARGVVGGAMFVDAERSHFYQRQFRNEDLDEMRREMREGLPAVEMVWQEDGEAVVASTSLPIGPWEVRLIEVDDTQSRLCVTLGARNKSPDEETDEEWRALKGRLRIERTFNVPADADIDTADAEVDECGVLKVKVALCRVLTRATASSPVTVVGELPAPEEAETPTHVTPKEANGKCVQPDGYACAASQCRSEQGTKAVEASVFAARGIPQ